MKKNGAAIFLLLALLAFVPAFIFTISNSSPLGDWAYHIRYAELYAQGKLAAFNETLNSGNAGMPYPPLFHLFLVPSVLLNIEISFAKAYQLLAYPIAILTTTYFVYRKRNLQQALVVGLLLLSSFAYFDRTFQANPQSFEMILIPFAYYFYFKNNKFNFALTGLIMIYSHGLPSMLLLAPLLLGYLQKSWKFLLLFVLVASPIIYTTFAYLPEVFQFHLSTADLNPQKQNIEQQPLSAFKYLGLGISIFSVLIPFGHRSFDEIDRMMLLAAGFMALMIPVWPERFLEYVSIPLAVLIANQVEKYAQYKKYFYAMMVAFAVFNIVFMISFQGRF